MNQTATRTATSPANPIFDPVVYWRVSAFALTAVALLGIVLTAIGQPNALGAKFLPFTWTHNILHVVLALAAFVFGFANLPANVTKLFAIVFGAVYATLGLIGLFVGNPLGSSLALNLTIALSIVHLALGGWGLVAGIMAKA